MFGLPWHEIVLWIAALLGAVLGVINTMSNLRSKRTRLKVVPMMYHWDGPKRHTSTSRLNPGNLCLKVVNLSAFPVTVQEVGAIGKWRAELPLKAVTFSLEASAQEVGVPQTIPARSSFVFYFHGEIYQREEFADVVKMYARTQCGTTAFGKGAPVIEYVDRARRYADAQKVIREVQP